ncbi:MAG: hypothetical protein J1E98_14995 [Lachnospiraceae bacterium]|nr:hypothetical protein [Lachnospiraceae bacterium]
MLEKVQKFIYKYDGIISFAISFFLILLLDAIRIITFDSVMPYIIGIGLWAVLWNFCDNNHPRHYTISFVPAVLICVMISINLCVERFLQFPFTVPHFFKFIVVCGLVCIIIRFFSFNFPSVKRFKAVHIAGSILFGLFSCAGNYAVLESIASPMTYPVRFLLLCILSFCSWTILFCSALNAFHSVIERIEVSGKSQPNRLGYILVWGISFLVCMSCYLPYLLTYYPGVIEYDSWQQIQQVFGSPYSNHHPWLHTMLIKAVYNIGIAVFHSENRSIALYSLCSMGMLSASFATAILYLYNRRVKSFWLILILAVSALSPINGIFSITMWKDIPFASMVLFFIILICRLEDCLEQQKSSVIYWILFVPVSFLMCFFRSNGLYVFVVMIPVMLYVFWNWKKSLILAITVVMAMIIIYKGPVFRYFEVQNVDLIESLSIPAQQIAAVISYNGNIDEKDVSLLNEVIDVDKVPNAYLNSMVCSDSIKDLVRETDNQQYISDNKGEFLSLWVRLGIHNKYYYVRAFIEETRGFWYHKTQGGMWATHLFEAVEGLGIRRECKLPSNMSEFIPNLLSWNKVHFSKYFSCGLYIYVLIFSFIESIRQRKSKWFATIPLIGIWLTLLIATPYFSDIRYIYAIHTALPYVMLIIMLKNGSESKGR